MLHSNTSAPLSKEASNTLRYLLECTAWMVKASPVGADGCVSLDLLIFLAQTTRNSDSVTDRMSISTRYLAGNADRPKIEGIHKIQSNSRVKYMSHLKSFIFASLCNCVF